MVKLRYIYSESKGARKTKRHPRPEADPVGARHVFKQLMHSARKSTHKCLFPILG